ncbi:MAG: hypothetical protein C4525_02070 [Desulfarculus sp.]|nr:MAG: hypothetical protein C4525_02070 [Desulfarculus sp.]
MKLDAVIVLLAGILGLAAVFWPAGAGPAQAQEPKVQGQRPVMVVDGAFLLQPGAWARYQVRDLVKKESSLLYIATLERTSHQGRPAMIMELEVQPQTGDPVVTRILAQDTPQGPGKVYEVVVQPRGYDPFTVPDSFLADQGGEAGEVQRFRPTGSQSLSVTLKGRKLAAHKVSGSDAKGRPFNAVVSQAVPPLGLISVDTPETQMRLEDWGQGARSRIRGEPMNFYLWLILQIGNAMGQDAGKSK